MSVGTIGKGDIALDLDLKPMWRSLSSAQSGLASSLRSIGSRASAELSRALKAGVAVGAATTAGVAAFSSKVAIDLENMTTRLRRVSGLTGPATERLADSFRKLAADTAGVKLADVFDVGAMAAKLGVAGDELGRFVQDILKFSAGLEGLDLEKATEGVVRLQTLFQLGRESTRGITSAIVGLDNISTASASSIIDISTRMAPMAAAMRMGIAPTLGLAAALTEAGQDAEVAGSAMTQLLAKLAERQARPALARVAGLDPARFGALFHKDPLDAIKALAAGMARLDPEQAVAALESLGLHGVRTRTVLLSLAQTTKVLDRYTAEAAREMGTGASVLAAFGLKSATTGAQLERLWNNIQLTADSIGKHMLPVIRAFADGMSDLLADVRASLDQNAKTFEGWGRTVAAAIKPIGGLWRNLDLYVEAAGAKMRETGERIAVVWERLGQVAANLWRDIKTLFSQLPGAIGANLGARLHNALVDALPAIGQWAESIARAITQAFGRVLGADFLKGLDWFQPGAAAAFRPAPIGAPGKVKVPGIGAGLDPQLFGRFNMFAGMVDQNGMPPKNMMDALFGALPDRAEQLARIFARIAANEQARDAARAKAARDAAQKDAVQQGLAAIAGRLMQQKPAPVGPQGQAQAQARARDALGIPVPQRQPRLRVPRRRPPGPRPQRPPAPGPVVPPAPMGKAEVDALNRRRAAANLPPVGPDGQPMIRPARPEPKEDPRVKAAREAQAEADRKRREDLGPPNLNALPPPVPPAAMARMMREAEERRAIMRAQQEREDDAARHIGPDMNRGRAVIQQQLNGNGGPRAEVIDPELKGLLRANAEALAANTRAVQEAIDRGIPLNAGPTLWNNSRT